MSNDEQAMEEAYPEIVAVLRKEGEEVCWENILKMEIELDKIADFGPVPKSQTPCANH